MVEAGPRPANRRLSIGIAAVIVVVLLVGGVVLLSAPRATPPPATGTVLLLAPTIVTAASAPLAIGTTAATAAALSTTGALSTTAASSVVTPQARSGKYDALIAQVLGYIAENRGDAGLDQIEAALKTDPQSYDLLTLRARVRAEIGDLRAKVPEDADAAIKLDPNRPEAYIAYGVFYQFRDKADSNAIIEDNKKAVSYYTRAIDMGSTDYYAYWGRGWANDTVNNYVSDDSGVPRSAIQQDLERAASFAPKDARFYQYVGDYYFGIKMYPTALTNFEKVASMQPGDTGIHDRLGRTYLVLNQNQKAYELYLDSIDKQRVRDPKYIADGAYIAWVNGQGTKANEWAELALTLEPNTPAAIYVQALLEMSAKNYDKALAKLDQVKAVTDRSSYEYPYLTRLFGRDINADRASALAALGRLDDALKAYDDAIQEGDNWIPLWTGQAQLLEQQGKIAEARTALRHALDLADQANDTKASAQILDLLKQLGPEPLTPTEAATP